MASRVCLLKLKTITLSTETPFVWVFIYVGTGYYYSQIIGSLAEWFKAPDLGSGIFGCMSSNLIAFIIF